MKIIVRKKTPEYDKAQRTCNNTKAAYIDATIEFKEVRNGHSLFKCDAENINQVSSSELKFF